MNGGVCLLIVRYIHRSSMKDVLDIYGSGAAVTLICFPLVLSFLFDIWSCCILSHGLSSTLTGRMIWSHRQGRAGQGRAGQGRAGGW